MTAILDEHLATLTRTRESLVPVIVELAWDLCSVLERGGKLVTFGNGGSAADAQHFAAELTGHFVLDRGPLPAVALTVDTSALTAIGNDYSYADVFARQATALVGPDDLVVAISTSSKAASVIRGAEAAAAKGARVWALTGGTGGGLVGATHRAFIAPSGETARIQEAHITVIHAVCSLLDDWVEARQARSSASPGLCRGSRAPTGCRLGAPTLEVPVIVAPTLVGLVADRTLDAELAALLWLLVEDGVPLIVTGESDTDVRAAVAAAVLDVVPERPWVILDGDADRPDAETLGATLRGGVTPAVLFRAPSLKEAMDRLTLPPDGLPEDAVRRLGAVLVVEGTPERARVVAAHYLRPIERDAQGHVQRRPPAVLATWDPSSDAFEHFAWGITPELADRVDRSQADLEDRQAARAASLARLAAAPGAVTEEPARVRATIAALVVSEPPRQHAPAHAPAKASGLHSPLLDPPRDPHVH